MKSRMRAAAWSTGIPSPGSVWLERLMNRIRIRVDQSRTRSRFIV